SSRIASGIRLAASKTSRIAERRAASARAATPGVSAPGLDIAMLHEARPGRAALELLFADPAFAADDLLRLLEHGHRVLAGDDQDAVELGVDDVARVDRDAADRHRPLHGGHLPPSDAVQGREVAVEDLEPSLAEARDAARVAVEDPAPAPAGLGRVPGQLAEVARRGGRGRRVHEHRVRREELEHLEVGAHPLDPLVPADTGDDVAALDG